VRPDERPTPVLRALVFAGLATLGAWHISRLQSPPLDVGDFVLPLALAVALAAASVLGRRAFAVSLVLWTLAVAGLAGRRFPSRDHPFATFTGAWDRLRIEQVVSNLLENALKFGDGKPVDVVLRDRGDSASIVVRDRGIGIAVADQERVFERFERAVSERHYSGIGLGLWICRRIVEAHGGTISVASGPGEGATFEVVLPRRHPGAGKPAEIA